MGPAMILGLMGVGMQVILEIPHAWRDVPPIVYVLPAAAAVYGLTVEAYDRLRRMLQ